MTPHSDEVAHHGRWHGRVAERCSVCGLHRYASLTCTSLPAFLLGFLDKQKICLTCMFVVRAWLVQGNDIRFYRGTWNLKALSCPETVVPIH